jgi:type IV secretory pathway VirB3-like protein
VQSLATALSIVGALTTQIVPFVINRSPFGLALCIILHSVYAIASNLRPHAFGVMYKSVSTLEYLVVHKYPRSPPGTRARALRSWCPVCGKSWRA